MDGELRSPLIDGIEDLELVGEGGYAKVYRGYQRAFRRTVAVKVIQHFGLDDDERRRFERECQAMGALSDHPNIVTLYDAGYTDSGAPYMVMPFVAAGTLQQRLRAEHGVSWEEAVSVGVRLCGALETSHRTGVVHRDVKPANVLRASYGVQLSDFGIARITDGHETRSGVITASIAHAPPEILDGEAPTPQADVYSLGSTLHEAMTGEPPFSAEPGLGLAAILRKVLLEDPPDLRLHGVPASVATVIERAMSKRAAERYQSAEEFARALQGAQRAEGRPVTDMVVLQLDSARSAGTVRADTNDTELIAPRLDSVAATPEPAPAQRPSPDDDVTPAHGVTVARVGGSERESLPASAPVPPPSARRRRSPLAGVALVASAVAVVGGAVFVLTRDDGARPAAGDTTTTVPEDIGSVPSTSTGNETGGDGDSGGADGRNDPIVGLPLELPPGEPIELELWHPGVQTSALEDLVETFEASQPDITVVLSDRSTYSGTLRAALDAPEGDEPDVILVSDRAVQDVLDGIDYVPVQDLVDRDDFDVANLIPAAVDRYSTDAGLQGLPFNVSSPMTFVNRDVFADAGIDLESLDDISVTELIDACSVIGDRVDVCVEFDNNAYLFEQMLANSGVLTFDEGNGRTGLATEAGFDDEAGRDVFDGLVRVVTEGIAVERSGNPRFFDGRSAVYMTGSGALGWVDQSLEDRGDLFAVGAASFIHADGADPHGVVAGGGALWILDSGDDRRTIASWLLLDHLVSVESQIAFHQASGYVPVRVDAVTDQTLIDFWTESPKFRQAFDELIDAKPGPQDPSARGGRAGRFHDIDRVLDDAIRAAQSESITNDVAFSQAVAGTNEVLAEYAASVS